MPNYTRMNCVATAPHPRRAFVLDIDGTLMPSSEIDNVCYWQAIDDVLACGADPHPPGRFANVSDSGILADWSMRFLGRPITAQEIGRIRERFLQRLLECSMHDETPFRPTPGFEDWLSGRIREGAAVAIATGGWGHTARFKLQFAGIDRFGLPLASSDDAVSRVDIMRQALALAAGTAAPDPRAVTYIGDGPWDIAASTALGWAFIGIATGEQEQVLRNAGASEVHADFFSVAAAGGRADTFSHRRTAKD